MYPLVFGQNGGFQLAKGGVVFGQAGELVDPIDPTFITTWQTTTAAESITLPLISSGTYNFTVDWGDGSTDTITAHTDATRIHEYAEAGEYDVRISGVCEHWNFNDVPASKDNILDVKNWGAMRMGSAAPSAFQECSNLDVTAGDAPDLTGVSSLLKTFLYCSSMSGGAGFRKWDVSNVTNMESMFLGTSFNQDIGGWDVSNVTNMPAMFYQSSFNQDISGWDVSNVTSMSTIFCQSPFNRDIGGWDVSNVTNMSFMFFQSSFNQDISGWDVSNVTNMEFMFYQSSFDQDIGGWDVSNVADMLFMFYQSSFNQDISGWDVSNVTNMMSMFRNSQFNQDISGWDVSNVTNMSVMFRNSQFNQDISGWDVSNVTNMEFMFYQSSFDQDIGGWSLRRDGVDMNSVLTDSALSTENYSRTLIGFANYVASSTGGPFDVTLGAGTLTYDATEYEPGETYTNAVGARAYLTGLTGEGGAGWTITDGGPA